MSLSEFVSPLIGRFVLAWFFLGRAISYAGAWDANIQLMALKNIPAPPAMLALAIMILWFGAISLVLGFQMRVGALLLFAFTIAATTISHDFWHITKPSERLADYALFSRDIAIAGGLLALVGLGPGSLALDKPAKPQR